MLFDFLGSPSEDFSDEDGRIILWARPRLLCTFVSGIATQEMARILQKWGDQIDLGEGEIFVFHDWSQLDSYDPEVRHQLVKSTSQRGQAQIHILLKTSIVSTGVSLASMFLSNMKVYTDENKFLAVLHKQTN